MKMLNYWRSVRNGIFLSVLSIALLFCTHSPVLLAQQVAASSSEKPNKTEAAYVRVEDAIYGRKFGTALTMDVFTPKQRANGRGIIFVVSGGYFSSKEMIHPAVIRPFLEGGYTVFAVLHGCQPRYQVPEIIQDMRRSVRLIRHHAKDYGVDPEALGATGGSAGGNLSLLLGTTGDAGNIEAKDPVEREPGRVKAVACFFPPTDFLNWGGPGKERIHPTDFEKPFRSSFDYLERNEETDLYDRGRAPEKLRELTRSILPIYFISKETVPALVIHGDEDKLVPLQQSQTFVEKLKTAGVPAKLIVKKGRGHGWPDNAEDLRQCVEWFDEYLIGKKN